MHTLYLGTKAHMGAGFTQVKHVQLIIIDILSTRGYCPQQSQTYHARVMLSSEQS